MTTLIPPYGGTLVDLVVDEARRAELRAASRDWPSWDLGQRQLHDLELLATGAFSPLRGFMGEADHASTCQSMRLADGTLWPVPITLDVSDACASRLGTGASLALRDAEGVLLARLRVESLWRPDRRAEARSVFGTESLRHPGAAHALRHSHPWSVGGALEVVDLPERCDFRALRHRPRELREEFARDGWHRVVAFQTRNPLHRAHHAITVRAAREADARLLLHPVVGMTRPGDVDHFTRVRCYQAVLPHYPAGTARLSLLPLAMRMAGPREALWHALIRRNHGCTHLIVGRDHAGPGADENGRPFYEPFAAQELLRRHEDEIGVRMVAVDEMVHVEGLGHVPAREVPAGARAQSLSGTELRRMLDEGAEIPEWFTHPEVARELRASHRPRRRQGFTVFFTGLSGAGKSTLARVLVDRLLEEGGRAVTLLDGDVVRKHLSSELGFSREHRDLNIRRIGWVASEITRHGGIAICAPIAPYDAVRREVAELVGQAGAFVLVHVSTPLETCEARDRKGLYAKARAGLIPGFTGISDPYEPPASPDLAIDTTSISPHEAADAVLGCLAALGLRG